MLGISKTKTNNNKATVPCLKACALTGYPEKQPNHSGQAGRTKPTEGGFRQVCGGRKGFHGDNPQWWKKITHLQSQGKWLVIIRHYFRETKGNLGMSKKHRRGAMMGQEAVKQPGGWVLASALPQALWPQWNLASLSVLRVWHTRIPENLRHYCFNNMKSKKSLSSKKSEDIYSLIVMTAFKDVKQ